MGSVVVGIAGGTGSGKTTIAKNIIRALPPESAVLIEHDSYYKDQSYLPPTDRHKVNFDHPDALDTDLLIQQLSDLKADRAIEKPCYDFVKHVRLTETERIEPRRVVVVEGILLFVEKRLRELCDIKLFVDTDADIRLMRRIRRDLEERERDFAAIRRQYYETVRPMHQEYVEPSRRWADLIIPEGGHNHVAVDTIVGRLRYLLSDAAPLDKPTPRN